MRASPRQCADADTVDVGNSGLIPGGGSALHSRASLSEIEATHKARIQTGIHGAWMQTRLSTARGGICALFPAASCLPEGDIASRLPAVTGTDASGPLQEAARASYLQHCACCGVAPWRSRALLRLHLCPRVPSACWMAVGQHLHIDAPSLERRLVYHRLEGLRLRVLPGMCLTHNHGGLRHRRRVPRYPRLC